MFHAIGIITVVCAIYWVLNKRPADGGPSIAQKLMGILLLLLPVIITAKVMLFLFACLYALRDALRNG